MKKTDKALEEFNKWEKANPPKQTDLEQLRQKLRARRAERFAEARRRIDPKGD